MKKHYGRYRYIALGLIFLYQGIACASGSSFELISSSEAVDQAGEYARRFVPSMNCLKHPCSATPKTFEDKASQTNITALFDTVKPTHDQETQSDESVKDEQKETSRVGQEIISHLSFALLCYLMIR